MDEAPQTDAPREDAPASDAPQRETFLNSRVGALVAIVVVIVIVAIVALSGGDDKGKSPAPQQAPNPPSPVSAAELASASKSLGRPIYWAGRQGGTKQYELTRVGNERVTVRYIPPAGADASGGSLTVATYTLSDALAAVKRAAQSRTAELRKLPKGGLLVIDTTRPTNVYFAYPDQPYQIEVFDPAPKRALKLVLSGKVKPVR